MMDLLALMVKDMEKRKTSQKGQNLPPPSSDLKTPSPPFLRLPERAYMEVKKRTLP
jgi:hypothetical protein